MGKPFEEQKEVKEEVKEQPKAQKGRDWSKIWDVFKSDNVFKDNDA